MKDFTDSYFYHILCGIFDLVILNLCWLLCCLPVVTIGAATASLYRAVYAMRRDEGSPIRDFFRIFRGCLKSAIPLWLLWLLAMVIAWADFWIIGSFWDFPGRYPVLGLLALVIFILLLWGSCLFPVLPGHSSARNAAANAFRLCFRHLPRVLPACLLDLIPVSIFLFWPYGFLLLTGFFILIWFSLSAYINTIFLHPILEKAYIHQSDNKE